MTSWTVTVAMLAWLPLVAMAFLVLSPQRAVVLCYIAGWLFLPIATLPVPGLPDYSKAMAVPLVTFLGVAAFDARRLQRFRPALVDLPMVVFCLTSLISSLTNDLGWYDAFSAFVTTTVTWGLPYLTGRLYFSSPEGLKRLALGVLLGGLVYAPLCLWEIRMSPQLHATLYGYHQHDWVQTLRGGGYRPMVFMNHGLMLGLWMTSASLVAFALWSSGAIKRLWGLPMWLAVPGLFGVTVLCKSFGALLLLLTGALALLVMRSLRLSLPMTLLLCLPFVWIGARITGGWSGAEVTSLAETVDSERSNSLEFRIDAEDRLLVKALHKPLFGWGGWGRSFVPLYDRPPSAEKIATDSLWIITLGKNGFVGLFSVLLVFLAPVLVLWRRCPPRLWASRPGATVAWALALVLSLYAVDNLVNAMENPIYLLIAGGLGGLPALRASNRPRPTVLQALPPSRPARPLRPPRPVQDALPPRAPVR